MDNNEDAVLVAATRAGDLNAFETLVQKYERAIFNAAYRIVGDFEQARDVAQTAFVKAFERLESYNTEYRFFSWLYRITINEALNLVSQRRSRRFEPVTPTTIVSRGTPEDEAVRNETRHRIQQVLDGMDSKYRVMIVLKHLAGCTYQEISEILEVPEQVVKSRLFRARQIMRGRLR